MQKAMIPKVKMAGLKKLHLYLDTCTTDDQVVDPSYLTKLHKSKNALTLYTNISTSQTHMEGHLDLYLFWYNQMGIGNTISLASLESKYHVRYDSKAEGESFIASTPDCLWTLP